MKCVNCGYEFFSQETLQRGVCPACGESLTVKNEANHATRPTVHWPQASGETDETVKLNAQVSIAINTRRIALVLILAVVLSVGSALVSLMIPVFFIDEYNTTNINAARALLDAWLLIATLITIFGLYSILFKKRLTRL